MTDLLTGGARFEPIQPRTVADLLKGDLGFSTIAGGVGGWVSFGQWLLRDACRYTHVFMVIDTGPGWALVVEAVSKGARVRKLIHSDRMTAGFAWVRPRYHDHEVARLPEASERYVGVGYGFATYAMHALHRIGVRFGPLDRYVSSRKTMHCAQLIDQILSDLGFQVFDDDRIRQDVTPGGLYYATDARVLYAPTMKTRATR